MSKMNNPLEIEEQQILIDIAEFSLKMLRKNGCSRESLKRMVDRVSNETRKGDNFK